MAYLLAGAKVTTFKRVTFFTVTYCRIFPIYMLHHLLR